MESQAVPLSHPAEDAELHKSRDFLSFFDVASVEHGGPSCAKSDLEELLAVFNGGL